MDALIFDLDNCLCPSRAIGEAAAPVFDAIRAANRGHLGETELQAAFDDCWAASFDVVARRHRFSAAMHAAGDAGFRRLEVRGALQPYDDLPVLPTLGGPKALVTTGYRRLQASKIAALGIAGWFNEVVIDEIDEPDPPGKQAIFERLTERHRWRPSRVRVAGDNPHSELAAGRALGMVTVQTLRPGVAADPRADHRIRHLEELRSLMAG